MPSIFFNLYKKILPSSYYKGFSINPIYPKAIKPKNKLEYFILNKHSKLNE